MNIFESTNQYETWLESLTHIDRAEIKIKHENMSSSPFIFLRATYYRWAQVWTKRCEKESRAPTIMAVGDLHVENYGTWRDAEGRLNWGVNDFDEASHLPYTNDLIRLATSAQLAIGANHLSVSIKDACDAILKGYTTAVKAGGAAFVLEEQHAWLRSAALSELRSPPQFWKKLDSLSTWMGDIPDSAAHALVQGMPEPDLQYRVVHRIAGEGSLGRMRFTAIASWHGSMIAREVKPIVQSAATWAVPEAGPREILYDTIAARSIRSPDPFLQLNGQWIIRRLAPHTSRIELADLSPSRDELALLKAMGAEAANVHLGTPGAAKGIGAHLKEQNKSWLIDASAKMSESVIDEWRTWRDRKK